MQLKFCIAKMVGTAPVYQTGTVNTWVSDITDSTVEWYASEGAARNALQGPETFVVAYKDITMDDKCEALGAVCASIAHAIDIGAILKPTYASINVDKDVFERYGITAEDETKYDDFKNVHGKLFGVDVYYTVWGEKE